MAGPSGQLRNGSRVSVTLRELSKFLGGPRWQAWWGFSAAHHAASNAGSSHMLSPWCIPWRYKVGKLHREQGHPASQVDWFWVRESHEEICLHNIVWYVLFPQSWQTCFGNANSHIRWNLFPPGTMEYYPPEYKIKGKYHGKSAVVWSLGVILFTMLCGRFPTSDDLHKTKLHLWSEPGLSKGEIFTTRKEDWFQSSYKSNVLPDQILLLRVTWLNRAKTEGHNQMYGSAQNAAIWSVASCSTSLNSGSVWGRSFTMTGFRYWA